MEIMPPTVKDDVDTDVEDETVEEQTALNNILSSKDTLLHTELDIKEEEEEDTSLLDTDYVIKVEDKGELQDFEGKNNGSSSEQKQQLSVEPKDIL
jgi:hypothetical protein